MRLNRLSIKDEKVFSKYLGLKKHQLSVYSFQNIFIWKGLFYIRWMIIEDSLCVFFKDSVGCFLYLPPLSKEFNPDVIRRVFVVMDSFNFNNKISRIENVEADDLDYYRRLDFECINKSADYLCRRQDLVQLKGNDFKSKRASFNYFVKHYDFEYLPYSESHNKEECLELYNLWAAQRKAGSKDLVYKGMIDDSLNSLKILLENFQGLNCLGRILRIGKSIKAFTFGFQISANIFCILYEITDLSVKGISQFIFREFCRELTGYKYINIMDDTGLDNLKIVKLSYRPHRLIPSFIIKRKEGLNPS